MCYFYVFCYYAQYSNQFHFDLKYQFHFFQYFIFHCDRTTKHLDEATGEMKIGVNTSSNREAKTQMIHPKQKETISSKAVWFLPQQK